MNIGFRIVTLVDAMLTSENDKCKTYPVYNIIVFLFSRHWKKKCVFFHGSKLYRIQICLEYIFLS